jgi:hypothetical protein
VYPPDIKSFIMVSWWGAYSWENYGIFLLLNKKNMHQVILSKDLVEVTREGA